AAELDRGGGLRLGVHHLKLLQRHQRRVLGEAEEPDREGYERYDERGHEQRLERAAEEPRSEAELLGLRLLPGEHTGDAQVEAMEPREEGAEAEHRHDRDRQP